MLLQHPEFSKGYVNPYYLQLCNSNDLDLYVLGTHFETLPVLAQVLRGLIQFLQNIKILPSDKQRLLTFKPLTIRHS
jgi:hypothetical protein